MDIMDIVQRLHRITGKIIKANEEGNEEAFTYAILELTGALIMMSEEVGGK